MPQPRNLRNNRALKFSWYVFFGMFFTLLSNIGLSFVGFYESLAEMLFSAANDKLRKQRFHEEVSRDIESLDSLLSNEEIEEEE